MTPEQMHAEALRLLADEFSRTHDQPEQDAQRFLARLARAGWRPVPALADTPAPARRAPRAVQAEAMAVIRSELAAARQRRTKGAER
jgi:hypothetical protein